MHSKLDPAVLELLELVKIDSPYSQGLLQQSRRRLVDRLLESNKIDADTADYLLH